MMQFHSIFPKSVPHKSLPFYRKGFVEIKIKHFSQVALSDLQSRQVRDMQVIGCLLAEIFLPKKFLALGESNYLQIEARTWFSLSSFCQMVDSRNHK